MTNELPRSEFKDVQCFTCQEANRESVYLPAKVAGEEKWVCLKCLPKLIHGQKQ